MQSLKCTLSSDFKKLTKTSFFAIHLFVPIACAAVFALYTAVTSYRTEGMAIAYFQVIAIAFPVVSAIVCSLMVNQEMDAGDAYFLLSSPSRAKALFSKFILAIGAGLVSCLLAAALFGVSLVALRSAPISSIVSYILAGVIVWACSIILYAIQMLTALKFGRNISIAVAAFESLIAALLLTGLGAAVWYILPPGWGVRITEMYLSLAFGAPGDIANYASAAIRLATPIIVFMTLIFICIMFIWFTRWDGRKNVE